MVVNALHIYIQTYKVAKLYAFSNEVEVRTYHGRDCRVYRPHYTDFTDRLVKMCDFTPVANDQKSELSSNENSFGRVRTE